MHIRIAPCVSILGPTWSEENVGSPVTGVTEDCEPSCGYCESNPSLLHEQQVLLMSEPFLQPHEVSRDKQIQTPSKIDTTIQKNLPNKEKKVQGQMDSVHILPDL